MSHHAKLTPAVGLLIITAVLGALSVALGAFGAHALKEVLTPNLLQTYKTAVDYHTFYSTVLLFISLLGIVLPLSRAWYLASTLFLLGVIFFSGSLYALSLSEVRAFGMLTPLGGVMLIAGWVSLGVHAYCIRASVRSLTL